MLVTHKRKAPSVAAEKCNHRLPPEGGADKRCTCRKCPFCSDLIKKRMLGRHIRNTCQVAKGKIFLAQHPDLCS